MERGMISVRFIGIHCILTTYQHLEGPLIQLII